ncbi:hypothetical protein JR065_02715 [Xanthomonas sp. AmX2]|uniref:hypothetical protein n=1 Tax=Xanthomonas sp. TaxID=29446 RepID=UPI00197DDFFB|nr:hypothetical protein [Xanthomonas sp.]MBN6149242.1 hypothetical protein [Xanthomonas sp.]
MNKIGAAIRQLQCCIAARRSEVDPVASRAEEQPASIVPLIPACSFPLDRVEAWHPASPQPAPGVMKRNTKMMLEVATATSNRRIRRKHRPQTALHRA